MKAITITALRSNLKAYFDAVSQSSEVLIIPRNNRDEDAVVVMSLAEYNALKETEYLLSNRANAQHLMDSMDEMEAGKMRPFSLDEAVKAEEE
jgi:antitoxin YefM